jgi:hypothetical protein
MGRTNLEPMVTGSAIEIRAIFSIWAVGHVGVDWSPMRPCLGVREKQLNSLPKGHETCIRSNGQ